MQAHSNSSLESSSGCCKACHAAMVTKEEREARPLSINAPLSSASKPALIKEVRSVRSQLKGHEAELAKVKRKLATESVTVAKDVKVCDLQMTLEPVSRIVWA